MTRWYFAYWTQLRARAPDAGGAGGHGGPSDDGGAVIAAGVYRDGGGSGNGHGYPRGGSGSGAGLFGSLYFEGLAETLR